jgi:hypothetical protein
VYVALNDPYAIAVGRIDGTTTPVIGSGNFTISRPGTGQWLLKIANQTDSTGTLLVSPEGGGGLNVDNIVTYQWNESLAGWIIESRDLPADATTQVPALQNLNAGEAAFSFAFFPVPEPTTLGLLAPVAVVALTRRRRQRQCRNQCSPGQPPSLEPGW